MTDTPRPPEPDPSSTPPARAVGSGIARGTALFFALVFLLNLLAQFRLAEYKYDPNHWWLSFSPLPTIVEQVISFCATLIFIAYAVAPVMNPRRARLTRIVVELLWVLAAWNVINYYGGLARGMFRTSFPISFSLFIAGALGLIWWGAGIERPAGGWRAWLSAVLAIAVAVVVFPLLQIFCFGLVDHRKAAQSHANKVGIAVVFNPGANSSPADVAKAAAELYRAKVVSRVFTSTDRAANGSHEGDAQAARDLAKAIGLPVDDVEVRASGSTTGDIVMAADAAYPKGEGTQLVPLGDYPQLPRIDMLFAQEGRTVFPVPRPSHANISLIDIFGEVPSLWKCYFGALTR